MGKIKNSDIEKVAKLANLELTNDEVKEFAPQLSEVVDFFKQLEDVDTSGAEPTSQTTGLINTARADKINTTRILSSKDALLNSKREYNDYFVIDALLDKNNL